MAVGINGVAAKKMLCEARRVNWEFPWMEPVLSTEPMSDSAMVREQGGWVLAGAIANSTLGFGFWAVAARLFTSEAVGLAGSLVSLSSLATSIGILGLDNGLVRFAARVSRPRALVWELLLVGVGLATYLYFTGASAEAKPRGSVAARLHLVPDLAPGHAGVAAGASW